jgi:hypothetical protein
VFDEEFASATAHFFSRVDASHFKLVTSPLVLEEISLSPAKVQQHYAQYAESMEVIPVDDTAQTLMQAYLRAGIVNRKHSRDAQHVALATVGRCDMIISWNLRHIVNYRLIPMYSGVNLIHGYLPLNIYSPMEVVGDVR